MLDPHPDLTQTVITGLGWLYLILFAMNACWTYRSYHKDGHIRMPRVFGGTEAPVAAFWALYSALLLMMAIAHFTNASDPEHFVVRLPLPFRNAVDRFIANPSVYFAVSVALFVAVLAARRWFARPTSGWIVLNVALLFLAISMTDWDFRQIVGKPDNVPIVGMLFLVWYFTWLYLHRAVENDARIAAGRPVREAEDNEKVLVWPDLVYTELICMIAVSAVLIFWGIALQAPLEEPASAAKTPNPSKAPWYFLGLQEMLVYFDPWLAGVVLPSLIIVGLMAIPYIDFNKKGNGYYTFEERKLSVSLFLFGFIPMWVSMIILGTFLRGPNWNIFGIYEFWDVHKLEALNNVNLSEYFWLKWTGVGYLPAYANTDPQWKKVLVILLRESPGIVAVLLYFFALPPMLALIPFFQNLFMKMGFIRYMVFANLLLWMAALPVKMLLRWSINLKYIIAIPEWFFNV